MFPPVYLGLGVSERELGVVAILYKLGLLMVQLVVRLIPLAGPIELFLNWCNKGPVRGMGHLKCISSC